MTVGVVAGIIANSIKQEDTKPSISKQTSNTLVPYPLTVYKRDTINKDSDIKPVTVLYFDKVKRVSNDTLACYFKFNVLNKGFVKNIRYNFCVIQIISHRFAKSECNVLRSTDVINQAVAGICMIDLNSERRSDSVIISIKASFERLKKSGRIFMPVKQFLVNKDDFFECTDEWVDSLKNYRYKQ